MNLLITIQGQDVESQVLICPEATDDDVVHIELVRDIDPEIILVLRARLTPDGPVRSRLVHAKHITKVEWETPA